MPISPKPLPSNTPRATDVRPTPAGRGYDADWQRLRLAVLSDEPLCRCCTSAGRVESAVLVDHIVPINDGGARLDRSNLQPLCRQCHAVKTGEDLRRRHDRG